MIEQVMFFDTECEPTHECPLCGRECFGDVCERCRGRLESADPDVDYE